MIQLLERFGKLINLHMVTPYRGVKIPSSNAIYQHPARTESGNIPSLGCAVQCDENRDSRAPYLQEAKGKKCSDHP